MGNASSKDRHDDTVDFGALFPQGIYTGPQDWNRETVGRLVVERKLAPFYRPLEDYEETWDDDQILAARKEPPAPPQPLNGTGGPAAPLPPDLHPPPTPASSLTHRPHSSKSARAASKEPQRAMSEAKVYRGAVECPICFLYYPPNINYSRCCDQAICTECFVQIKRAEPTPTHLESEPACCPYCVRPNFGVLYKPPSWRAGINSDATLGSRPDMQKTGSSSLSGDATPHPAMKQRRPSTSHTSDAVVTIDQIRPDWEDKLKAVKAAVARRANRRIIMRQVGDRLIPIGVTSGRIQVMDDGGEGGSEDASGRRSRRRPNQSGELGTLLNSMGMGMGGQDLDELLLQEAMRLSLLEHEAEQKKHQDEKRKKDAAEASGRGSGEGSGGPSGAGLPKSGSSSSVPGLQPVTSTSTREPSPSLQSSHLPVSSSGLAGATAAIAMGTGLPQSGGSANRSASHSRNPSASSHSRNASQASTAPSYNALAAAVNATSIANAIFASGGPSAADRVSQRSADIPPTPPLPIVVPAADLLDDVVTPRTGNSGRATPVSEEPPTVVQGVTATSLDIPSPPADAESRDVVTPTRPMPAPHQTGGLNPSIIVHSSSFYSVSTDASTEDEATHPARADYMVLPSTPNLSLTDPLLSDNASTAGLSTSH